MQVVVVQLDIAWEDKPENFRRVRQLLATTHIEPGALVLLPEMFATGFSMHVEAIAEATDGPTHAFLAELAREHRAFVVGGVVTRAVDGRGRNEAVTFAPDGKLAARYAKLHPFSFAGETKHYEPGREMVTFTWHDLTVAPFVCYDLRFPEVFRQAVRRGAQLLAVIANWPLAREAHWLALLTARAIENQAFVVGVNRAGSDPHAAYGGRSLVVDPRGNTIAAAGAEAQALVCQVDAEPLVEYRRQFPALADMQDRWFA
jgi:predicted amidohydrolase